MAGEFTAGLSGGQRKILLFELIRQRIRHQSELLLCLDEPFAGVTDDFVPYIVEVLEEMRAKHNVLLVTNDHVSTLTGMADNTITVSALDRTKVKINGQEGVGRDLSLHAVATGKEYVHETSKDDLWFFFDVEVASNPALAGVAGFTTFVMILFIISYWNSAGSSTALVLVALQILCFFCINPYLIALSDWRNFMTEEAEALMHSSVGMNKALKSVLTLIVLLTISIFAFLMLKSVLPDRSIQDMGDWELWVAMLFDSASLTLPFICFGLYTSLPLQVVQILASFPFLFMIFFSTTFSPGAGLEGVKGLRFLFARFYLWCVIPGVMEGMEDCPKDNLTLYTVLSGCLGLFLFLGLQGVLYVVEMNKANAAAADFKALQGSDEFKQLQVEMKYVHTDGTPRGFGQTGVDYKDGYEATATEDSTITVSGGAEPPANEL
uniref:Uncharacterized protein n=3 Tax=Florenciella parvula TaxID=236787 RepID=A0A7S2FB46_9STRA|mmetsp:Transcript_11381/g.23812  ORF Transcript_11381/g.23812 Transcript_11381/m.23812 type:complete len:436 (+) Transcript_11381:582-1889(+)